VKASGDLQLIKRINRSALLRLVRGQSDLSRARLAHLSGLTKSTVSALVRELLDEHWLVEAAEPVLTHTKGRPSTPINIDSSKRVLIGVEIAVDCLRLVCVSLSGAILMRAEEALRDRRPDKVCGQLGDMVRDLCLQLLEKRLMLSGVGVCLPGAVDAALGLVRLAPNLGWRDLPFMAMLSAELAQLGIPASQIHLQNDADAAALGEYEFGSGGNESLIFVNCDVGVGAGVVLNDQLYTGFRGSAGEIGHSILQVNGPPCSCGRRGCVEAFVGAPALATEQGLARGGHYLGVLLQNLDAMFNPHAMVLGGRSCIEHPSLIDAARDCQRAYAQAAGLPCPTVTPARFGVQAAAVGAAALVLHHFLRPLQKEACHVPGH